MKLDHERDITPLLLIGAQKSGSSYLFNLISQNSTIATPREKEPKIFSKPMNDSRNYMNFFRINYKHKYALDGSTSYLHVAGTAEQVAIRLGTNIPILAVLRKPSDRAVSGYLHEVKHGREMRCPEEVFDLPFDEISKLISAEDAAIQKAWYSGRIQPHGKPEERYRDQLFQFRYIANSHYYPQLEPWINRFTNVRLIDFQKLQENPGAVMSGLYSFLELGNPKSVNCNSEKNVTKLKRWKALRENRSLQHDHSRPKLLTTLWQQYTLFSRLQNTTFKLNGELESLINREFLTFKNRDQKLWI